MKTSQTIRRIFQLFFLVLFTFSLSAQTVKVDGKKTWTDAGIDAVKGQQISLTASGRVYANNTVQCGPEGITNRPDWRTYCVVNGKPHAGLIMKIGNGNPFFAGNSFAFSAPQNGRIYLGINDNDVGNNKGEFSVVLSISTVSPLGSGEIKVSGKKAWTATGVQLSKGQNLEITASGNVYANATTYGGPDGITNRPDWNTYCVVKGKPVAGLIAKIGNGNPFFVGSSSVFKSNESGELFLGVNDTDLGNNKGEFIVSIEVRQ